MPARSSIIMRLSRGCQAHPLPQFFAPSPLQWRSCHAGLANQHTAPVILVRRFKIVITRFNLVSRPTTGSSLPCRASCVKSVQKVQRGFVILFLRASSRKPDHHRCMFFHLAAHPVLRAACSCLLPYPLVGRWRGRFSAPECCANILYQCTADRIPAR